MNKVSNGDNRELYYHYYNTSVETCSVGIYIIASIRFNRVKEVLDWAVYLGASLEGSYSMEDGVQWAAVHGEKLALKYAKSWFPYLPEERYRR